jgi:hypothetical protein
MGAASESLFTRKVEESRFDDLRHGSDCGWEQFHVAPVKRGRTSCSPGGIPDHPIHRVSTNPADPDQNSESTDTLGNAPGWRNWQTQRT